MLEVEGLEVCYGGAITALRGVTLEVPDGAVVAVLGSNGAGKSTLMRAISGVLGQHRGRIERGEVRLGERRLNGVRPAEIVRAGVVQVPEGRRIFADLTVEENLRAGAFTRRDRGARAEARQRVFDLFPILRDRLGQRAGLMSGGEQQMLAIGRALMASPRLLLLDEPSLGLAPLVVGRIGDVIAEINGQGTSVLLVEQNATMALRVAQQACVLELGRVSLAGSAEELSASDDVRNLYLGQGAEANIAASARRAADAGAGAGGPGRPRLGRWIA